MGRQDREIGIFDWLADEYRKWYREFFHPEELKSPVIIQAFREAWRDSLPGDKYKRHEEGLYWGFEKDGSYGVRRWSSKTSSSRHISPPPLEPGGMFEGLYVMGDMHTHPNPRPVDEFGQRWPEFVHDGDRTYGRAIGGYRGNSYVIDNLNIYIITPQFQSYIISPNKEFLGEEK